MEKLFISLLIVVLISGCASRETFPTHSSELSKTNADVVLIDKINSNLDDKIDTVGVLPAGLTLETIPGVYGPKFMTHVVQPARVDYVSPSKKYKWIEGEVKGFEEIYIPDETPVSISTETLILKEASTELVTLPPLYNKDGSLVRPATVIERIIPAITKNVDRRTIRDPAGPIVSKRAPYVYKNGKTRVPVYAPIAIEKHYPAITEQIEINKLLRLPTYIILDEMGQIVHRFETRAEVATFLMPSRTP